METNWKRLSAFASIFFSVCVLVGYGEIWFPIPTLADVNRIYNEDRIFQLRLSNSPALSLFGRQWQQYWPPLFLFSWRHTPPGNCCIGFHSEKLKISLYKSLHHHSSIRTYWLLLRETFSFQGSFECLRSSAGLNEDFQNRETVTVD